MLKPVLENPWVQMAALLLALGLAAVLVYFLSPILIPLGFALLAAYVLDPVVNFCQRIGIRRQLAISVLAIIALAVVLSVPVFLVPSVLSQAEDLIKADARDAVGQAGGIQGRFSSWFDRQIAEPLVKNLNLPETNTDTARVALAKWIGREIKANAVDIIRSHGATVASAGQHAGWMAARFFAVLGNSILSVLLFLANFALFAFVAGYMLNDFHSIEAASVELIPPKYRAKTVEILSKIDQQLRGFLRGQLTVCFFLGALYMIGLLIAGTPFAVPIAVFGAVASFVPYMGITLTIAPSVLLSLLQHGVDWHVAMVLLTFVVAQFIEGMILTPKIMGDNVGLSPVWVILAIMVFGTSLGFLGLLLAVPIAAALKVLVVEAVAYYKASRAFNAEEPPPPKRVPQKKPAKSPKTLQ
ncbi:MAG: AI-2E family transporter [Candidatus Hydrogenedentes bacterium]|nr:AI-2E family transporter [Candidatus Hydrogenedentota bacterium]